MGSIPTESPIMEVEVKRTTVIQPDYGTDKTDASLPSSLCLTVFDMIAVNVHVAALFAFAAPTPSNFDILRAISRTIFLFPTLAGSFSSDRRSIDISPGSTAGVLVVEAAVPNQMLSDLLPLNPELSSFLHPPREGATHLLQVQLTRFSCGGLVLAFTNHHRVADGQSMSLFYTVLGRALRGDLMEPGPSYDQTWLQSPRLPRFEYCDHWDAESCHVRMVEHHGSEESPILSAAQSNKVQSIRNVQLRFSADFIQTQLKQQLPSDQKYSTFQVLVAHPWRKITIARRLSPDTVTHLSLCADGRQRLRPPITPTFFGNLVLEMRPHVLAADITAAGGAATAAWLVREAVVGAGDSCFRSVIDYAALHGADTLGPLSTDGVLCPDLEVDSWLGFKFEDFDIGECKPCGFSNGSIPAEGVLIMFPECRDGGKNGCKEGTAMDVCVNVTLFEDSARELIKIAYSVD